MDLNEIENIVRNLMWKEPLIHTELLFPSASLSSNGAVYMGVMPYKRWRGVACGFIVTLASLGGQDPEVEFGVEASDIGADADFFGSGLTVPGTGTLVAGDVFIHDPAGFLQTPEPLHNVGSGTSVLWYDGGEQLNVWQDKVASITLTRPNDHQLSVLGFMAIEVEN